MRGIGPGHFGAVSDLIYTPHPHIARRLLLLLLLFYQLVLYNR